MDKQGAAAAAAAADAPAAAEMAPPAAAAPVAMKQRKNRGNLRKRATDDDAAAAEADDDKTAVVRKAKQQRGEPLAFSTKKEGPQDVAVTFASTAAALAARDESATKTLETETEFDRDSRAQRERLLAVSAAGPAAADGKYRGANAYVDYKQGLRREGLTVGSEKGSGAYGPLRGNVFVRTTARFDYQPDICKDYKETGFCSYGDSCKFMHDRGDYKSGWELEAEWEAEQKRRQEALAKGWGPEDEEQPDGEAEGGPEDDLPFACYICRWGDGAGGIAAAAAAAAAAAEMGFSKCSRRGLRMTCILLATSAGGAMVLGKQQEQQQQQQHHQQQHCLQLVTRNTKNGKCAACEQSTQGIFNIATDILKKMKKAKEAAPKEAAEAEEDA
uniref:C3H1-type domain-containing protein n=1 Tax=Tetradesmus obliquus TaxID=3088 RepID=A0A383WNP3_TETOB|eukprot:jgi/Sobl393_1/5275/SZX79075.1